MQLREVVLLTNPSAGKGRGALGPRRGRAPVDRGRDPRASCAGPGRSEALDLARAAVVEGTDALVVCGGDGLVHLGTQVVAGTETPLGIIPAGTGNDVARYVDLPRRIPPPPPTDWRRAAPG